MTNEAKRLRTDLANKNRRVKLREEDIFCPASTSPSVIGTAGQSLASRAVRMAATPAFSHYVDIRDLSLALAEKLYVTRNIDCDSKPLHTVAFLAFAATIENALHNRLLSPATRSRPYCDKE